MKRRNLLLLVLAGVAVAAAAAWALQARPVAVETAPVVAGIFEQTVSDDGRTRVRDRYTVAAPLAGRIERVGFEPGDAVTQGQTIAVLTPTSPAFLDARTARELQERSGAADAHFARARADTLKAAALRDQARADLQRQEQLSREGFVSKTAHEQAQLAYRTAERTFDAARFAEDAAGHDVAQARAALARYRSAGDGARWQVASPVSGVVLKVLQKSEGPVALGASILEIGDTRSIEAVVDVLSQEAVAIVAGMPAKVEVGPGVAPLAARVRLVEPSGFTKVSALGVEEQRVNVILDFTEPLDHLRTLGDGFRIDAHVITFRAEKAIKAPVGALFRDSGGWAVFVARDGRAAKRAIKAPRRNGAEAMVEEGLSPGEQVIVYPSDALRDGSKLAVSAVTRR